MSGDAFKMGLEAQVGRTLDTDEAQIEALMELSGMGHAEASDELRIARDEFPDYADEMA